MTFLFIILLVIVCFLLALVVLVQNPKGGGLSGTIAGFSNQFMGVKQTTDVLEKTTWLFSALVGILCLLSTLFISKTDAGSKPGALEQIPVNQPVKTAPKTNTAPLTAPPVNGQ